MPSGQPPIAVSSGEPAGIGPDICLSLASTPHSQRLVVLGDPEVLRQRARLLASDVDIQVLEHAADASAPTMGQLQVIAHRTRVPTQAGKTDSRNAEYILDMLRDGATGCLEGRYSALVTAPVHKSVVSAAGFEFTGHTEFLAQICDAEQPVMLLARGDLRVALVTTHLALRDVPDAITAERISRVAGVLDTDLRRLFGIAEPRILVLGLNPHAGEDGTLGREEQEIIEPCLGELRRKGFAVTGPRPADTAFSPAALSSFDAVLAMYHDQGLTPIKAEGFGQIVNVTLGLPIIRTSVDHGTALSLAGTGKAEAESLHCAVELAAQLAVQRAASR